MSKEPLMEIVEKYEPILNSPRWKPQDDKERAYVQTASFYLALARTILGKDDEASETAAAWVLEQFAKTCADLKDHISKRVA